MGRLTQEECRSWFPDDFFSAIDSWFAADIACCDLCYDEFLAKWPHSYLAENAEFQKTGYPLDVIYSGSRLVDEYSKAEFETFIKDIECPRCGNKLASNIWAYNFPFDVEPEFEDVINQIADIAKETPFLILKHDFANRVYDSLRQLACRMPSTVFDAPLYRARAGDIPEMLAEFDAPLPHVVIEGRYNHAGSPVVYLASDAETCVEEMWRTSCTIAEIALITPLKVLDLNNPEISHPDFANELSALTYSALMSAKQPNNGWHKPAYVFSRFISDCAKASGIQAIKYPSTQIVAGGNFNLVIIDPSVRLTSHATLLRVKRFESETQQFVNRSGESAGI